MQDWIALSDQAIELGDNLLRLLSQAAIAAILVALVVAAFMLVRRL